MSNFINNIENSDYFLAPLCLVLLRLEEEVSVTIKVRKWESILTLLKFVIIAHVVYGVCSVCATLYVWAIKISDG